MAHFARMNSSHEVKQIFNISNSEILDSDTRDESETIGIVKAKLANPGACATGGYWKQCSYNTVEGQHLLGGTPLRANFPKIGWFYNSEHDIFHKPRPTGCDSWTLNTSTGYWEPPHAAPELTEEQQQEVLTYASQGINKSMCYVWDESAYQADNTQGWVLTIPSDADE